MTQHKRSMADKVGSITRSAAPGPAVRVPPTRTVTFMLRIPLAEDVIAKPNKRMAENLELVPIGTIARLLDTKLGQWWFAHRVILVGTLLLLAILVALLAYFFVVVRHPTNIYPRNLTPYRWSL